MASQDQVVCRAEPLQGFVEAVTLRIGADVAAAREVARHLVRSNLSGHDSHGVLRIPQYVADADRGELHPGAQPRLEPRSEVAALVDAGRCFGHVSTMLAMRWAIERARRHGLAPGQTSDDGRFTLLPVCCLGNCDKAPTLMIDEQTFGEVDPQRLDALLEAFQ